MGPLGDYLVTGTLLLVGAGSITGREVDGGPLVAPAMLGYLGMFAWILRASVALWRSDRIRVAEPVPASA